MPRFTIDLTDAAVERLQAVVTRYTENTGQDLTLQQWLLLHLREIATAADLEVQVTELRRQAEVSLQLAIAATRRRILDDIG